MHQEPKILGPDGKPAPKATAECPRCKAAKDKRVASSGFGRPHDVCSVCGYEWKEYTLA